jgi:exosome complex component RRP41
MTTDIKLIDENGRRVDGRTPEEMRPLKIEAGVLKRADGSAYVE